jgi:hypothetical protein
MLLLTTVLPIALCRLATVGGAGKDNRPSLPDGDWQAANHAFRNNAVRRDRYRGRQRHIR